MKEPFPESVAVLPTYSSMRSARGLARLGLDVFHVGVFYTLTSACLHEKKWVGLNLQLTVGALTLDTNLVNEIPADLWYQVCDHPLLNGFRNLETAGLVTIDPHTAVAYLTRFGLDRLLPL
jgi:hypothetical protein